MNAVSPAVPPSARLPPPHRFNINAITAHSGIPRRPHSQATSRALEDAELNSPKRLCPPLCLPLTSAIQELAAFEVAPAATSHLEDLPLPTVALVNSPPTDCMLNPASPPHFRSSTQLQPIVPNARTQRQSHLFQSDPLPPPSLASPSRPQHPFQSRNIC